MGWASRGAKRMASNWKKGRWFLGDIPERRVQQVRVLPCLSFPPGLHSTLAPSSATHCRDMGPVLSYRSRFGSWRAT